MHLIWSFECNVNYLKEGKLTLKLFHATCSDNVGELINNTAILEHNTVSKSTCATFRNMVCTGLDLSAKILLLSC